MALSLIPGAAHVDLGRTIRGLFCFLLFALCLNGALVARFLSTDPEFRVRCALGAGGVWFIAFLDALRIVSFERKPIRAGGDAFPAKTPMRRRSDWPEGKRPDA
jgi:hypothetical protein